jgi:hypothetical protein
MWDVNERTNDKNESGRNTMFFSEQPQDAKWQNTNRMAIMRGQGITHTNTITETTERNRTALSIQNEGEKI